MRSILIRIGILIFDNNRVKLNFDIKDKKINNLLREIIKFIYRVKDKGKVFF